MTKPQYIKPEKQKDDWFFTYNTLQWNVSAALRFISENRETIRMMDFEVSRMEHKIKEIRINIDHAEHVDLSSPILVVKLSPFDEFVVIDGHHRIYKALKNEVHSLPSYVLEFEQQLQFVTKKQIHDYLLQRVEEIRPIFERMAQQAS